MILNSKVIHNHILKQTLQQEITRLRAICNSISIASFQNKLRLAQRDFQLLVYEHNQHMQDRKSNYYYRSQIYEDLMQDKIVYDEQLTKKVVINRKLLGSLLLKRRELQNRQSDVNEMDVQLKQTLQQLIRNENKNQEKDNKRYELINSNKSLENIIFQSKNEVKSLTEGISAEEENIKLELIGLHSIQDDTNVLSKEIETLRAELVTGSERIEKQNKICSHTLETFMKQLKQLKQSKECKNSYISNIQSKIEEEQQKEKRILNKINLIEKDCKNVQQQIVQKMSLSQQISAQLFETKVNRTNIRISIGQCSNKLAHLRQLKTSLWKIMTKDC